MFRQLWMAGFEVEVQPHERFGPGTAGGYRTPLWGVPVPGTVLSMRLLSNASCVTFSHIFFGYQATSLGWLLSQTLA